MPDVNAFTANILEETQRDLALSQDATKITLENSSLVQNQLKSIADIYGQVSADMAVVKSAEQAARLTTQAAALSRANALGVDPRTSSDAIVELATKKVAQDKETEKSLIELHRRAKVTPQDGILNYVGQQLFGVYDARQVFRANASLSEYYGAEISKTNKLVQETVQTYTALQESVTQASAAAATRIAAAEGQLQAKKVAIEGFKYDTDAINTLRNISKDRLQALISADASLRAAEQLRISQEHLDLSKKSLDWQQEERALNRAAKAEGKELDEYLVDSYNYGRASLGLPPVSGMQAKQMLVLLKGGKQEFLEMVKRGELAMLTNKSVIGTSAADSIKNLSDNPGAVQTLPEIKTPMIRLLNQAREMTRKEPNIDVKDNAAIAASLNKNANRLVEIQYQRADSSPDNIFNPGDLKQYLGSAKQNIPPPRAIASLPIYTKFLKTLAESDVDLSDPKVVYNLVYAGVLNGQITLNEAAQLSVVYGYAAQLNMTAKGITGFGIVPPEGGHKLNVGVGKFGTLIDIADPVVLTRKLSSDLARDKYGVEMPQITDLAVP